MFVFATAYAGDGTKYRRYCHPSVESVREPDDVVMAACGDAGLAKVYNRFIDEASSLPSLEALILVHEDVVISDPALHATLRNSLSQKNLGVIGVIGGRDLRTPEWGTGRVKVGRVRENGALHEYPNRTGDVDVVDGLFLAISPLAMQRVRFDSGATPDFHGYDSDFCLGVRSLSLRVYVADILLDHYTSNSGDRLAWQRAMSTLQQKHRALLRRRTASEALASVSRRLMFRA